MKNSVSNFLYDMNKSEILIYYGYLCTQIDLFQTVDLYEKKDIANVTNTLFALGRTVSILNIYIFLKKTLNSLWIASNYGLS